MMKSYPCTRNAVKQITVRGYCFLLICLFPLVADAVAQESIEQKVAPCAACHGANGISVHSTWPNLAGQDTQYIVAQLKAFRDGARESAMMYPMAFDLTDMDIDDMANYYHQLKCD